MDFKENATKDADMVDSLCPSSCLECGHPGQNASDDGGKMW